MEERMLKTKVSAAVAVTLLLLGGASAQTTREETAPTSSAAARGNGSQRMSITRSGANTPARGPEATFTGTVSVEPLFPANAPSRASGARVAFEPGARSNWHTHPLGQNLIVTE